MKVCYVTSGLGVGGAEFALLRLCRALRSADIETSIVSASGMGPLAEQFEGEGIHVTALDMHRVSEAIRARGRMRRHLQQTRPQVIHGWMYHGNLIATWLAKADGVERPLLWGVRQSLHGNRDKMSTRLAIRLSAALSEGADAIVYNSSAARVQHEAIGFYPRAAHVIANGFDLDAICFDRSARESFRTSLGLAANSVLIGHVARFHPSKDHAGFLGAFARVAENHAEVRAVLAGEGVDSANSRLTQLLEQLGIADRVQLLGRRSDIHRLMSAVDIFCSSSNGMEGFPNVVAEAMCCEVPCVATDVGDARTVIGPCGKTVAPGDVPRLAAALDHLVTMPGPARRAIGSMARQRIATNYSAQKIAEQYVWLYRSMLNKNAAVTCAA